MGDLALEWDSGSADLVVRGDDLASEEGLRTAVLQSLFLDRRAEADDVLPADDGDRRGWWGDEFAPIEGDRYGSRLWLLDRGVRRPDVARLAEEIDREALAWMLDDRVTPRIEVAVSVDVLGLVHAIDIYRPTGDPVSFRFVQVWDGEAAR